FFFFFSSSRAHPYLHSFPTRRSSDLRCLPRRSAARVRRRSRVAHPHRRAQFGHGARRAVPAGGRRARVALAAGSRDGVAFAVDRSEEHTSELQSRSDLVCRLLLEKKK